MKIHHSQVPFKPSLLVCVFISLSIPSILLHLVVQSVKQNKVSALKVPVYWSEWASRDLSLDLRDD